MNDDKDFEISAESGVMEVRLPIKMLSILVAGVSTLGAWLGSGVAYRADIDRVERQYQTIAHDLERHLSESEGAEKECRGRIEDMEFKLRQMERVNK